jgi:hypothetical protein
VQGGDVVCKAEPVPQGRGRHPQGGDGVLEAGMSCARRG